MSFLANLPNKGNFVRITEAPVKHDVAPYVCTHNTDPPESQIITTDPTNILIRNLTKTKLRESNGGPNNSATASSISKPPTYGSMKKPEPREKKSVDMFIEDLVADEEQKQTKGKRQAETSNSQKSGAAGKKAKSEKEEMQDVMETGSTAPSLTSKKPKVEKKEEKKVVSRSGKPSSRK
eukprot:TRINITY_DN2050_c0_g2_i5.p1 TRINITY_DN2050_c0_g2~~TRINITY_DN2050_c0_g2_i5.p1  ORF type:complete len:179 (+),score=31.97 TRINITY_DN2050_c0_g2_i5:19-555(+)